MITNNDVSWLILVVEDIEETRDGIEKLLKAEGYRVLPARSPEDAIQRVKHQLPDLLLVGFVKFRARKKLLRIKLTLRNSVGLVRNRISQGLFGCQPPSECEIHLKPKNRSHYLQVQD